MYRARQMSRRLVLAAVLACGVAGAQGLVAPKLDVFPDVAYPRGEKGDRLVRLIVTVGKDGAVTHVEPASDEAPGAFVDAAVAAVKGWRFEPATRDGAPISAKIRIEVAFREVVEPTPAATSAAPPATAVPPATAAPPASAAPPPPAVTEVRVLGEKSPPAVSTLTRAEVRQLPGAFGDPFRAIEVMPGVTPIVSGLPYFYVRGAPPGNVGYYLDGVRVPYLYHVALGPSVVHPGMVERVDLYPGGYPASFGRFAGGIVSGETTAPTPTLHGEGNVRLLDVGALAEGGFADGRGTVLLGGRYSYTAAIVSLLADDIKLAYRDFQARASYDVTPKDRVSVFTFGAFDLVAETKQKRDRVLFGSEFYRADLRLDHDLGGGAAARIALTLGLDQSRFEEQQNVRDRMIGLRAELVHPLSSEVLVRAGADVVVDVFDADDKSYSDPEDPDTARFNELFPRRTDVAAGLRADVVYRPTRWVEVTPGLRFDAFTSKGASATAIDPRISAKLAVSSRLRFIHAYGIAHQPPSFIVPISGLQVGGLAGGLQSSVQTSAGVEADLPSDITATGTLFHNAFFRMTDALGTVSDGDQTLTQRSSGEALGVELFVRRKLTRKLGGLVSYTLSRSTRSVGNERFPSNFDRTHVANAAVAYDLGRRWRAGTRLVFYTGVPKTTSGEGGDDPPRTAHPPRDPAFYRVDVRVEKRWTLSQTAWFSLVFEVLNTTLSKEQFGDTRIGPITIPSVGLEGGYAK